jgi:hypothetical protein
MLKHVPTAVHADKSWTPLTASKSPTVVRTSSEGGLSVEHILPGYCPALFVTVPVTPSHITISTRYHSPFTRRSARPSKGTKPRTKEFTFKFYHETLLALYWPFGASRLSWVSADRLYNTVDSWVIGTIKYIVNGRMVVSGQTKMSVTEQRSI